MGRKGPILGDIPFLGFFFKSHTAVKNRTEGVILLTPHVMMVPEDAGKASAETLKGIEHPVIKEGRDRLLEFNGSRDRLKRP